MSEENVELLYRSIDAISRRDLEAFMALMDQGVQAVPRIVTVEGRLRGHEGIRQWWDTWLDAFPDWKVEVVGVRDDVKVTGPLLGDLRWPRASGSRPRSRFR